jgi:error-prone DNA polymerase
MTSPLPAFAELYCRSNFSFLTGASHPEELVAQAIALGYAALAITDECSLAGVVRAHAQWRQQPDALQLLIGTSLQLADGPRLVLIATDRLAYGCLSSLVSKGRRAADKGAYHLQRGDLEGGLHGCLALLIPPDTIGRCPEELAADACWLASRFPGSSWLAAPLQLGPDDAWRAQWIGSAAKAAGIPIVSTGAPLMHTPERKAIADVLGALRHRCNLDEAGYLLASNREAHLQPRARLGERHPAEWLAETLQVAARCSFTLDTLRYEYPEEIVPPGATATSHLHALVEQGLHRRYPEWAAGAAPLPDGIRAQVDKELGLIAELRYEAFFLTVYDIVRFARSQNILCQGRGSAANSAVCYCLGITEVDPSRSSVLFERFISKERNEPPDIDVDFEHERREEVIQYLYTNTDGTAPP